MISYREAKCGTHTRSLDQHLLACIAISMENNPNKTIIRNSVEQKTSLTFRISHCNEGVVFGCLNVADMRLEVRNSIEQLVRQVLVRQPVASVFRPMLNDLTINNRDPLCLLFADINFDGILSFHSLNSLGHVSSQVPPIARLVARQLCRRRMQTCCLLWFQCL